MSGSVVRPPENKMGTMPIGKLLFTMSLPMIVSMLVQALYNIVDSMFVAQIGENALTAVSLAFPVQNLMIGAASGTGVGVNAILSKSLGEKNHEAANRVAVNSLFLAVMTYLVFAAGGVLFSRAFFLTQTDNPEIVEMGTVYTMICTGMSLGVFFQIAFERLLQSTGRTFQSMLVQLTGAVINIILDPILIFGWFGLPAMGVAGAALATVIGQVTAGCVAIWINHKYNPEITLRLRGFRPDGAIIKRIYAVGVPSILMSSIGSVMTYGMNNILIVFSSTATAVFGVYFKLQSFIFMPVFGLNNGMVPIIAFNYGARNPERILKTMRLSIFSAVTIMLIGLAVFWIFPEQLLGIFNASPTMLEIGIPALRIISLSFIFAGFCIITISTCQALGHGVLGMVVSLIRQLVFLLPSAFILAKLGGLDAVWWSFPIAEVVALALCLAFKHRIFKEEIYPLFQEASDTRPANP